MELVTVKNAATLWQLLTPAYACLPHDMRCLLPKSGFFQEIPAWEILCQTGLDSAEYLWYFETWLIAPSFIVTKKAKEMHFFQS